MNSLSFHDLTTPHPGGFRDVAPEVLHRHAGSLDLVDVRETAELDGELGHIAGIRHVPLATVTEAARHWDRTRPVVVVCRSGGRSSRAAEALISLGFRHVYNMTGGMLAWNEKGLPVTRRAAAA